MTFPEKRRGGWKTTTLLYTKQNKIIIHKLSTQFYSYRGCSKSDFLSALLHGCVPAFPFMWFPLTSLFLTYEENSKTEGQQRRVYEHWKKKSSLAPAGSAGSWGGGRQRLISCLCIPWDWKRKNKTQRDEIFESSRFCFTLFNYILKGIETWISLMQVPNISVKPSIQSVVTGREKN